MKVSFTGNIVLKVLVNDIRTFPILSKLHFTASEYTTLQKVALTQSVFLQLHFTASEYTTLQKVALTQSVFLQYDDVTLTHVVNLVWKGISVQM